jgi:hypothetical protein
MIYHDGEQHEKVDLESIETEAEMIQMMIDKEFRWKPQEQVAKKTEEGERNERMEEAKRKMEAYMKNRDREKHAREQAEKTTEKEGEL